MRITIEISDALLAKASGLTTRLDVTALVNEGLKALIARESARRFARLGGCAPSLKAPRRRRASKY